MRHHRVAPTRVTRSRRAVLRGRDSVVGIDGYAGGWVAVRLRRRAFEHAWCAPSLTVLLGDVAATTVGVDIPLGLLEVGWRSADRAAAARLGARRASVFAVPPRPVWAEADHAAASRACRELTGAGVSMQAWRLGHKIMEADAYRDAGPHELFEVHPELVFAELADGASMPGKKTWNGHCLRRALLGGVGVVVPDRLDQAGGVPGDDVLDAAAAAWSAYRIAHGLAAHVPDPPDQHDHRGRPIVTWF